VEIPNGTDRCRFHLWPLALLLYSQKTALLVTTPGTTVSDNWYSSQAMKLSAFLLYLVALVASCCAQSADPSTGPFLPAQSAADVIRQAAGADGAFLAAAFLNRSYDSTNLASLVQSSEDKIVIVALKGSEVKQALARSISLYPQSNSSFLQLSGFAVRFKGDGPPASRVLTVTVDGAPLDLNRTYNVAMPSSLAVGALGYFKIWDKSKITKTLDTTVGQALSGKPFSQTSSRWVSH
jgi:hypothetical protein